MNKYIRSLWLGILCLCAVVPATAQISFHSEYWVDHDPGLGKAVAVGVLGANAQIDVPTGALANGWHVLGLRVVNNERWSPTYCYMFFSDTHALTDMTAAEYFIDSDPGFGQATGIPFSPSSTALAFDITNTDALAQGWHLLGMRVRRGGHWSQTYQYMFYSHSQNADVLTAAEYFLDSDPGYGQGTAIPFSAHSTSFSLDIPCSTLSGGVHTLGLRVRQGYVWSQTYYRSFLNADIEAKMRVEKVEAWWDNDLATLVNVPFEWSDGVASVTNCALDMSALPNGKHLLHLLATADGHESLIHTYEVCKSAMPNFAVITDPVYEEQTIVFEDRTTNADANTIYSWDMDNDGVAEYTTAGNVSHVFEQAGTYTVTLTVQEEEGCEETFSQEVVVYAAGDIPQGLEDIHASSAPRKILINDVIYILRGDKVYSVTGQEMR